MGGRILVTGATGFLGKTVLRRLGRAAIGQGRDPARCAALSTEGYDVVQWSLPQPAPDCAKLRKVDTILHCAALSSPFGRYDAFHAANVEGMQAVLNFAHRQDVKRLVFISSPSIYFAPRDQLDVREDMRLPPPFTPYAKSKVAAEELVRCSNVPAIILRPRGIYGPSETTLLPRLLKAANARALPRFRSGRARIDLTFVDDVVEAILAALDADPTLEGQAFNISGGETLPISEIVEAACEHAGIVPRWCNLPLAPALMAARVAETHALMRRIPCEPVVTQYGLALFAFEQSLDLSRARDLLDWEPKVRFADGLGRVFDKGANR